MTKYYCVRVGRVPGIYLTWKECEVQVKGYSKAKYKSFKSKEEAEELVNDMSQSEVDDDAQDRDYSDFVTVLSVDELSHANQNHK